MHGPREFPALLHTRAVDVAIGPRPDQLGRRLDLHAVPQLRAVVVVAGRTTRSPAPSARGELRGQTWLLGPSAATDGGVIS